MNEHDEALQQAHQQMLVLWGALAMGVVTFLAVVLAAPLPRQKLAPVIGYAFLLVGVMELGPFLLFRQKRGAAFADGFSAAALGRYRGLSILLAALAEVPGLLAALSVLLGQAPFVAPVLGVASGLMFALSFPNPKAAAEEARSLGGLGRTGGAGVALLAALLAAGEAGAQDLRERAEQAAARAMGLMLQRQKPGGNFDEGRPAGFKLYERHIAGIQGVVGLALLAQRGWCEPARQLADHLVAAQRPDGCLAPAGSKCNLEHSYCTQFLIELALAQRAGRADLGPERAARVLHAARMAVGYLLGQQHADGGWPYGNGWGYLESAIWAPVMESLLLARALGLALPPATLERGLAYAKNRELADGFLNGEREVVMSPHVSGSVLSVLEAIGGPATLALRQKGWAVVERLPGEGYFAKWGFEPTDPKRDSFASLKQTLGARRHLYGCYYQVLCYSRRGDAALFEKHWEKVATHLLAHRTGEIWASTAGELPSTALAVLSLVSFRGRLALYGPLSMASGQN